MFLPKIRYLYLRWHYLMKHSWINSFNLSFSFEWEIVVLRINSASFNILTLQLKINDDWDCKFPFFSYVVIPSRLPLVSCVWIDTAGYQATPSWIFDCEVEVCSLQLVSRIDWLIRSIYLTCDIRFVPLAQLCLNILLVCAYLLEVNCRQHDGLH